MERPPKRRKTRHNAEKLEANAKALYELIEEPSTRQTRHATKRTKQIKNLFDEGLDVNYSVEGTPLLSEAVVHQDREVMKALFDAGADVNILGKDGFTPLMWAAETPNDIISDVIAMGANIDQQNEDGETALHNAASHGWTDNVETLIEHGADIEIKDAEGNTPLMMTNYFPDVVDVLIRAGADIENRNDRGLTPLMKAIRNLRDEDYEVSLTLIENGANVNATNGFWTPLNLAIRAEDVDLVQNLIDAGANVNHRNNNGHTPLIYTILSVNWEDADDMLKTLIDGGADVNLRDSNGDSPLQLYIRQQLPSPQQLISRDGIDLKGAVFEATKSGSLQLARIIIYEHYQKLQEISEEELYLILAWGMRHDLHFARKIVREAAQANQEIKDIKERRENIRARERERLELFGGTEAEEEIRTVPRDVYRQMLEESGQELPERPESPRSVLEIVWREEE